MGSVETSPENQGSPHDAVDQFAKLEKKLDAIEGRLKDKWIMPVALALLAAILTCGNYFIQRLYANADLRKNEMTKVNAQTSAKSTSDFYQVCYSKLDTINKNFDSYCNITPSKTEDSTITWKLIELTDKTDKQFPLDPRVQSCLKEYSNFISDKLMDFEQGKSTKEQLVKAYTDSKILYDKVVTEINSAFLNPSR
jgi:hypothetical protein